MRRKFTLKKEDITRSRGKEKKRKEDISECWICELPFARGEEKVLDHCHYTNKFLVWAHNTCNINRKTTNFIPVVAHNLANYDLHCIIRALNKSNPLNVFSVIPSTEEKFISMTISVWIKTFYDKSGKFRNVFENLRFIDSYKFMQPSLSTLVNNLENFFKAKGHSMEKIDLLKRKGFYPYSYIDSFKKFNEPRLPARRLWTNSLAGGEVGVDRSEFNHAIIVFSIFGCNSIGDYYDLYLSTDVLLLASVFEAFRSVCYETYGVDCAHYYTASNLAGDVFLKVCRADLRLLTERDHLHLVERMIRGGMSSVYARKYWKANNQYLDDHDKIEENSFIVNIDANNLYRGFMQNYSLPLNDFEWADDSVDIPKLVLAEEDSEWVT